MANIQKETKITHRLTLGIEDFESLTRNFGDVIITLKPEQLLSLKETIDNALTEY